MSRFPRALLLLWAGALCAQTAPVKVWEDTAAIPTYREKLPDEIPPFDQVHGEGNYAVYPYTLRDNLTSERSPQTWRVLHLENEYLHCRVLPDLGGKMYGCLDKLSGKQLFYVNTSVKKTIAAPRGAWVAGGIETSFPIAHTRLAVSPVHFAISTDPSGAGTVTVGAVDRISGMEWRVAYTLRPGSAVLEEKVRLYNRSSVRRPYQWWTNAAIPLPDSGLRLTYPMWVTAPHGAGTLNSWPRNVAGVDMTSTANYNDTIGVFGYGSREPFFGAYSPETKVGVAHWADPKEVPGKKVWVWAHNNKQYREQLSDDHSGYTEIQAGLLTTQDMMEFLEPQHSRVFTELWIPSRGAGGITRATPDGTLFLERRPGADGNVVLAFDVSASHAIANASMRILDGSRTVYEQSAALDPAQAFHRETSPVSSAVKYRFELRDGSGKLLLAHVEDTYDALPASQVKLLGPVPGPPEPKNAEELALSRGEQDELVRYLERADSGYRTAVSTYSKSARLRKALARFCIGLGRFAEADELLAGLSRESASDQEIAYYRGVARARLGDDKTAQEFWSAVPPDSSFHDAAQFELACARARQGDRKTAAAMLRPLAEHGLARAAGLEIALLRRLGQTQEAAALAARRIGENPTDSFLRFEGTLLGREDPELWGQLAGDPEWLLDVVDDYLYIGLYDEPVTLLSRQYPQMPDDERELGMPLPQDYALASYYRGYARMQLGQSPAEDFAKASQQSTRYVHPSRPSSAAVLQAAIRQNPQDTTAHYLLGCLWMNRRMTDEALAEWNLAKPAASRIPAFYDTVAGVMNTVKHDKKMAEQFVEESSAANPSDESLKRLMAKLKGNPQSAPAPRAAAFVSPEEAAVYAFGALAAGQFPEAAKVFQPKNFPQEKQPAAVRQAYIETELQLMLAAAKRGMCHNVELAISSFGAGDKSLPFTFSSFGAFIKQPRTQFYFGLLESACGDRKAAAKRWGKVARETAPVPSADFAFPILADALLNPAASMRTIEQALEKVHSTSATQEEDKGLLLYAEGMLLRALRRDGEAASRFAEGAKSGTPYTRYLNGAAQFDPPLPRM